MDDDLVDELEEVIANRLTLAQRRANAIDRKAHSMYAQLLCEWATRDDGELPTWNDARAAAAHEINVVCAALGPLAEHRPEEIFPRSWRQRPRPHD